MKSKQWDNLHSNNIHLQFSPFHTKIDSSFFHILLFFTTLISLSSISNNQFSIRRELLPYYYFCFPKQIYYSYFMKSDQPPLDNSSPLKNDSKTLQAKDKIPSLPNVAIKNSIKIPQSAKKIGNYILGKSIGSGTFGKVHLGIHILTGEKVAVKIIEKAKIQAKDVQRVKNQIEILRTTRHRNLIHLYEIIETQKSLLLFTEYMVNGELFSYIVKQKKISEEEACHIFHQLIDGVEYLHRMGITHRDLKPENIMIDYDNQIKIIDFGLSRTYSKGQRLASACGSPCYASPQMIQGKVPYDPQLIDIWSCGIILYAMVCGALPFMESETPKLYKRIVSGNYRPITGVSEEVKDLIQKILVVNPNKRITIQQIKQHQWWQITKYQPGYGLYKDQRILPDEEILNKTVALGFDRSKIMESLQKNDQNKQTGAYYLLMKKMVRSGVPCPKYIGGQTFNPNFIEYIFPSFQEQTSDTAFESGQCTAQMPQTNPEDPTCTCTENIEPFKWWVFIGTKEYQKVIKDQLSIKNLHNTSSIVVGYVKKKSFGFEEQKKRLFEEQESVVAFKTQRKKKKSEFYGKDYKKFIKGTLNLKEGQGEVSYDSPYLQIPKSKKGDRLSTLDTLTKKQKRKSPYLSVNKFDTGLKPLNKYQNLPKIVKNQSIISKNKSVDNNSLVHHFNHRRLKPISKILLNSIS